MPIYEYRCQECGHQFNARRSMQQADDAINCPKCDSSATKRALSRFFARTTGEAGSQPQSVAGSSACSTCSATSCSTCSSH